MGFLFFSLALPLSCWNVTNPAPTARARKVARREKASLHVGCCRCGDTVGDEWRDEEREERERSVTYVRRRMKNDRKSEDSLPLLLPTCAARSSWMATISASTCLLPRRRCSVSSAYRESERERERNAREGEKGRKGEKERERGK
jgi:hypothetical protein